jgi:hypothetical protein
MSGDITDVTDWKTGTRYRAWARVKINHGGVFFRSGSFGGYSGRAGRALAFLHEIAHMVLTGQATDKKGRSVSQYFIPDDKDKKDKKGDNQSKANTKLIAEKCKKELEDLKNLED